MIRAGALVACLLILAPVSARGADAFKALQLDRLDIVAPKLPLVDSSGHATELRELAPGKNLVVHFWASWCKPCEKELPQFATLAERSGDAVVRAISIDSPADAGKARDLFERLGLKLPFLRVAGGPDESSGKSLWAWGLPITYFMGADGKLRARAMGPRDWSALTPEALSGIFQNK
jgi:thiol-disulfide isomerase/thioredoxin